MLLETLISILPDITTAELGGVDSQFKLASRTTDTLIKAYKNGVLKRRLF